MRSDALGIQLCDRGSVKASDQEFDDRQTVTGRVRSAAFGASHGYIDRRRIPPVEFMAQIQRSLPHAPFQRRNIYLRLEINVMTRLNVTIMKGGPAESPMLFCPAYGANTVSLSASWRAAK